MLAPPFSTGPLDTMWAHVAKRLMLLAIATRSCGALVPPQQSSGDGDMVRLCGVTYPSSTPPRPHPPP